MNLDLACLSHQVTNHTGKLVIKNKVNRFPISNLALNCAKMGRKGSKGSKINFSAQNSYLFRSIPELFKQSKK